VPTVREEDGLACSSRNQYLNPEERKQAAVLHKALMAAKDVGRKSNDVVALAEKVIKEAPLARIDYVQIADAETLKPVETVGPNSVLLLAVFFGKTRLIDNTRLA
jgi:pantoate--beta-alanine ligase